MHKSFVLRGALVGALTAVVLGLGTARADACSCVTTLSGQPACKFRWISSAVFTARIVEVESAASGRNRIAAQPSSRTQRRVRVAVREAFVGAVPGAEIDIFTGWGDADCGYMFEPGREYLIYAGASADGSLGTSLCTPTKRIEEASADLVYLRAVPGAPSGEGRLIGLVSHIDASGAENYRNPPPFAGGRVIVVPGPGLVNVEVRGVTAASGAPAIVLTLPRPRN